MGHGLKAGADNLGGKELGFEIEHTIPESPSRIRIISPATLLSLFLFVSHSLVATDMVSLISTPPSTRHLFREKSSFYGTVFPVR